MPLLGYDARIATCILLSIQGWIMPSFRVAHPIAYIRQPSQNDCWAAATAMARGRRSGTHLMVSDVKRIAARNRVAVNANGSLPANNLTNTTRLASALGMRCRDVRVGALASLTLERMRTFLERGRLALFGFFDFPRASLNHVITIYRMYGDGTPRGTTISVVDPYVGRAQNFDWEWFDQSIMADPHFIISP